MVIGLYHKKSDTFKEASLHTFEKLLTEKGITSLRLSDEKTFNENEIDLIVVFGGDGTVLRAVKFAKDKIPLVAVNYGNLGFLTSYEASDLKILVSDIVNDKLKFTEREFITVSTDKEEYLALNDAVVLKNHLSNDRSECIKLTLEIDGRFVDQYIGDGLIVSTPTGSTAYALSAGGPIMVPTVNAYVVAPICVHSLHSRPIVYPVDSVSQIKVSERSCECTLVIDGENLSALKPGSVVTIKRSNKFAKICDDFGKFFSKLSDKLNKWSKNDIT